MTTTEPRPHRSKAEIEAQIAATRESLAETVDELTYRLQPATMASRAAESTRNWFVDPVTGPNYKRIGLAAVGALVVLVAIARR